MSVDPRRGGLSNNGEYASRRAVLGTLARVATFIVVLAGSGAIGYWSWVRMHLVAVEVCGIGVGVSGRIGINIVGLLWLGCSLILGAAAGGDMVYGTTRGLRVFGVAMLVLLIGGTVALQLWSASYFGSYCGGTGR
ncbi:hypothetical protein [Tsukamurella pseudospumae]|uniref:hypothetical protein n=1 Tax=Tsukamurella pseudospumae TaxID=239498 RepID=UPI000B211E9F|nr:hypothetical protein [Tsukamurella pseudospumae]